MLILISSGGKVEDGEGDEWSGVEYCTPVVFGVEVVVHFSGVWSSCIVGDLET